MYDSDYWWLYRKILSKKEQSIDNQQKGFFAPLFSLHVFFYLRGLCASFCIRKDTLLAKITKKKRQLVRKRSNWQAMIAHDDSLRMGLDGSLRIGSDGSLRIGSDGSLRIGSDDSLRISLALTRWGFRVLTRWGFWVLTHWGFWVLTRWGF